jgi:hypothetical protein
LASFACAWRTVAIRFREGRDPGRQPRGLVSAGEWPVVTGSYRGG